MGVATKTFCLGVTTALIAYIYIKWQAQQPDLNEIEKRVTEAWSKFIKQPKRQFSRLAVGTNANVDLIVSGTELLRKLNQTSAGPQVNHARITTLADLQQTFAYFFSKGRAAERIFTDPDLYKQVVEAVFSLGKVERYIGGNAALMAKKAASLFPGVQIQFVGPVGPILQKLIPSNISIPASSLVQSDEFHLIMEYKVGEKWGKSSAPVATRFICSYDASNSEMTMLETFFASLPTFGADLILLSGLHMLDGQDEDFFQSRLDVMVSGLKQVDPRIPVHLEFASMVNAAFVRSILEKVLPQITSLGLNEQELGFSSVAMGGPHSQLLQQQTEGQPPIHVMSDLIHWMLSTFGRSAARPQSRLTRVHFHSLTYHIVGVHRSRWRNVRSATVAGTRIAGLQACDVQVSDPELVDLRIPLEFELHSGDGRRTFDAENPVHTWTLGEFYFVFSPVLVCKDPVKTVGLGDAISATGLMFSEFSLRGG